MQDIFFAACQIPVLVFFFLHISQSEIYSQKNYAKLPERKYLPDTNGEILQILKCYCFSCASYFLFGSATITKTKFYKSYVLDNSDKVLSDPSA
jgi:hypothetical protein